MKQFFKWGVSKELVPAEVYGALVTVRGLSEGRTKAVESDAIEPVADEIVDAILPHLSSVVRAMVQVQRLNGARPGEICTMKVGELSRVGEVWTYKPPLHKTRHKGHRRTIYIGPKAQAALTPFLMKLDPTAHVFSPRAAVEEMRQRRAAARVTPISCGNTALLKELREHEKQAAQELGQWTEHKDMTSGGKPVKMYMDVDDGDGD